MAAPEHISFVISWESAIIGAFVGSLIPLAYQAWKDWSATNKAKKYLKTELELNIKKLSEFISATDNYNENFVTGDNENFDFYFNTSAVFRTAIDQIYTRGLLYEWKLSKEQLENLNLYLVEMNNGEKTISDNVYQKYVVPLKGAFAAFSNPDKYPDIDKKQLLEFKNKQMPMLKIELAQELRGLKKRFEFHKKNLEDIKLVFK